ncbi:DUF2789 family protein [Limnohabitans sp.]|jgi:hypothetical protein|uniref:DUF2789 family protein n=1 Tax=Limnohabitans sp. TaxID=1907725 RepID=UPI0037BF26B5
MDTSRHPFHELFAQMGLPCDAPSIAKFIQDHSPLPGHIALPDAEFWTPAQAEFLRETWLADAEWANQVDQLSEALRAN